MYRHTQIGWTLIVLAVLILGFSLLVPQLREGRGSLVFASIALALFSTMTITVDEHFLRFSFGPGLIRWKYRRDQLESWTPTRSWLFAVVLGIHKMTSGWLFNVHGSQAVKIQLKNGRIRWIGTDEPDKLCRALEEKRLKPN